MKMEYRPYVCSACGHKKQIRTNHLGECLSHCENCSWKSNGFAPGVHMFGTWHRTFRYDEPEVRPEHAFCSSCGTQYESTESYPRICKTCDTRVWANPTPVVVLLVPVRYEGRLGLLVARRAIDPSKGSLAFIGGFLEAHETWQEGGAREALEETGVVVDPTTLVPFWFASTHPRPNRVLLFALSSTFEASNLRPYTHDGETSERGVVFGPSGLDEVFAFPTHIHAAQRFFAQHGIEGSHDYKVV